MCEEPCKIHDLCSCTASMATPSIFTSFVKDAVSYDIEQHLELSVEFEAASSEYQAHASDRRIGLLL